MPQSTPAQLLPGLRLAIGVGMYAFPVQTGKAFQAQLRGNHEALFLGRLFGARDVALGAGALASQGPARRLWWQIGVACDLADAAAGVIGLRTGAPKLTSVLSTVTALAAAGMGIAILASEHD